MSSEVQSSEEAKINFLIQMAMELGEFTYSELWQQVRRVGLAGTPGKAGSATFDKLFQRLRNDGVFKPLPNVASEGKKLEKPRLKFTISDIRHVRGPARDRIISLRLQSYYYSRPILNFEKLIESSKSAVLRLKESGRLLSDKGRREVANILKPIFRSYIILQLFLFHGLCLHPSSSSSQLLMKQMQRLSNEMRELLTMPLNWKERSQKRIWFDAITLVWGSSVSSYELPDLVGAIWEQQGRERADRSSRALKTPGIDAEALMLLAPLIAGWYEEASERSRKSLQLDLNSNPPREFEVDRVPDGNRIQRLKEWNDFYEKLLPDLLTNRHKLRRLLHWRKNHPKTGAAARLSEEVDKLLSQLETRLNASIAARTAKTA